MTSSPRKLPRSFYERDTTVVARDLLGKILVHRYGRKIYRGKIVETESYLGPHDLASHSSKGKTARTTPLFGPVGRAYVYLIYGMHECLNVVTEKEGKGSAVLIRALEPIEGITKKTSGPGLLTKAMHITRTHNSVDLGGDTLYIEGPATPETLAIIRRPRIGVDYARHWSRRLLRFYIKGNPHVSRK